MKFLPRNTLAHYNAAPQVHLHNLSDVQVSVFSASTLAYRQTCGLAAPQDEAVTFYALNHCVSVIRKSYTAHEPLPEWAQKILTTYTDICVKQGERMLHYILSITVREMRHLKSGPSSALWTALDTLHGGVASAFIRDISSNGGEEVAVKKYMQSPPGNLTVGAFTRALSYAFHHGNWSPSYGGPAWGGITDALISMIDGTTSMEMLVDTGYTLAHNTAPIFNKMMMYTSPDSTLLTILDVQRAGQLPEVLLAGEKLGIKQTPEALEAVTVLKAHKPEEFKGYVDWVLVDSLRPAKDKSASSTKYAKVIAAQNKKPKVKVKPVPVTFGGQTATVTGTYAVFPGQMVPVLERGAA